MKQRSRTITTAAQLKRWRKRQRWTQLDAAIWAGVDLRTWRRWENGEVPKSGILPLPLTRRIQEYELHHG